MDKKSDIKQDLIMAEKLVKRVRKEHKKKYMETVSQLEKRRSDDYESYLKAVIYMFTGIKEETELNKYSELAMRCKLEEFFGSYMRRVLKNACDTDSSLKSNTKCKT